MNLNMKEKKKRGKQALKNIFLLIICPTLLSIFTSWKVGLSFFGVVSLIKVVQIRRRKYFMKDVAGEEVGLKSFMKRWKDGIEGITPLQQAWTNLLGSWITLTGVLSGMIINALVRVEHQWIWIEIVLLGSLILIVIQMIGGLQKYWKFKIIDKAMKEANGENDLKKKKKEKVKEIKMEKLG